MEDFVNNIMATQDVVGKRLKARTAKATDVTMQAIVDSFEYKESMKPVTYPSPLAPQPAETKDGKKYSAPFTINGRLTALNFVPDVIEARTDGLPGYRVGYMLNYFADAETYLVANAVRAYLPENAKDPECIGLRTLVGPDGILPVIQWENLSQHDSIKIRAPDSPEGPFRQMNPRRPSTRLVQPNTPCRFFNVIPEMWVGFTKIRSKNNNNKGTTAAEENEDNQPQQQSDAGAVETERVTRFQGKFVCKTGVAVADDFDADLCQSELMHDQENPSQHWLVPIAEVNAKRAVMPRNAYFYVSDRFTTPVEEGHSVADGISSFRCGFADLKPRMEKARVVKVEQPNEVPESSLEISDYINKNQKKATYNIRFDMFQWHGEKNTHERYVVKVISEAKEQWRVFGITDPEVYGLLMLHNPVPVHVRATIWQGATTGHDGNRPELLNAVPGDRNYRSELANIKGYYVCGGTVVPDFLRYFLGPYGIEVSMSFVEREFARWDAENKFTKHRQLPLKPSAEGGTTPLNNLKEHGVVTALGNGKLAASGGPANHAYDGDAACFLEGNHRFFVLTSKPLPECKMPKPGEYFDEELINLSQGPARVLYWIYAVRRDAKMAPPKAPALIIKPQQQPPSIQVNGSNTKAPSRSRSLTPARDPVGTRSRSSTPDRKRDRDHESGSEQDSTDARKK